MEVNGKPAAKPAETSKLLEETIVPKAVATNAAKKTMSQSVESDLTETIYRKEKLNELYRLAFNAVFDKLMELKNSQHLSQLHQVRPSRTSGLFSLDESLEDSSSDSPAGEFNLDLFLALFGLRINGKGE